MKNYWYIKGYSYWESELSVEKDGSIWINIGFHLPMLCNDNNFTKTVAISAYTYSQKFN
jgi:hypothetical protein